jgi:tripartite-type tricarboxylate transporter receptor subunit TctC
MFAGAPLQETSMQNLSRRALMAALATAAMLAAGAAPAQDAYPVKPIRLIVSSPAGSGPDVNAREMAAELTKALGQTVYVENRPGASGSIGADLAAKAAPDGYTLFVGTNNVMAVIPHLYRKLPFNVEKDFAPISLFGILHVGLVANAGVPANDVPRLLAAMKAKPDTFNVATLGVGSFYHMAGEWFGQASGQKLNFIPYNSNSPYADLISGQVQLIFDALPLAAGSIRAGKLKLLALTGKTRHPAFPNVPTFAEAGLADYEPVVWTGLFAPAGTPKAVIDKLNAGMHKAVQNPDLRERWSQTGGELRATTPVEFAEYAAKSRAAWGKAIRQTGVQLD